MKITQELSFFVIKYALSSLYSIILTTCIKIFIILYQSFSVTFSINSEKAFSKLKLLQNLS